jgi:hypothetical protein
MTPVHTIPSCISDIRLDIVAYLLKARTVEPEKQSLLANGSETIFVSRQLQWNNGTTSVAKRQILNEQESMAATKERLGKQIPAATGVNTTE